MTAKATYKVLDHCLHGYEVGSTVQRDKLNITDEVLDALIRSGILEEVRKATSSKKENKDG